jgi:hypothetical protein
MRGDRVLQKSLTHVGKKKGANRQVSWVKRDMENIVKTL